jgi:hypothetical protein
LRSGELAYKRQRENFPTPWPTIVVAESDCRDSFAADTMLASPNAERLAQQARFVFKGKVRKLKASTVAGLEADDSTAIVTVEEIVHLPQVLVRYAGKDITVRLRAKKKLKVGAEAVFFTNSLRIGENIAVTTVSRCERRKGESQKACLEQGAS